MRLPACEATLTPEQSLHSFGGNRVTAPMWGYADQFEADGAQYFRPVTDLSLLWLMGCSLIEVLLVWGSPCQAQISPTAHLSICSVPPLGRTLFHAKNAPGGEGCL